MLGDFILAVAPSMAGETASAEDSSLPMNHEGLQRRWYCNYQIEKFSLEVEVFSVLIIPHHHPRSQVRSHIDAVGALDKGGG
jgi:hypothetical protein